MLAVRYAVAEFICWNALLSFDTGTHSSSWRTVVCQDTISREVSLSDVQLVLKHKHIQPVVLAGMLKKIIAYERTA